MHMSAPRACFQLLKVGTQAVPHLSDRLDRRRLLASEVCGRPFNRDRREDVKAKSKDFPNLRRVSADDMTADTHRAGTRVPGPASGGGGLRVERSTFEE